MPAQAAYCRSLSVILVLAAPPHITSGQIGTLQPEFIRIIMKL